MWEIMKEGCKLLLLLWSGLIWLRQLLGLGMCTRLGWIWRIKLNLDVRVHSDKTNQSKHLSSWSYISFIGKFKEEHGSLVQRHFTNLHPWVVYPRSCHLCFKAIGNLEKQWTGDSSNSKMTPIGPSLALGGQWVICLNHKGGSITICLHTCIIPNLISFNATLCPWLILMVVVDQRYYDCSTIKIDA